MTKCLACLLKYLTQVDLCLVFEIRLHQFVGWQAKWGKGQNILLEELVSQRLALGRPQRQHAYLTSRSGAKGCNQNSLRITFAYMSLLHRLSAEGAYYGCADYISTIRLSFIIPDHTNLTIFQPPNYLSP